MDNKRNDLNNLIQSSQSILLLTHRGPDVDAFCSMILLYKILKSYYPEKNVQMQAKQQASLNLPGMQEIKIVEKISDQRFDLVLVTDALDYRMCLEEGEDDLDYTNIPFAFIDHHDTRIDNGALVINNNASSATEEVYSTFKEILGEKLVLDTDLAKLIQYGIVADTGRFLFENTTPDTMRVFADAKAVFPVDLEEYEYKTKKFPIDITPAISEYLKSLTVEGDMAYVQIKREAIGRLGLTKQGLNEAQTFMRDSFVRYIQGVHWGFVIKPDYEDADSWFVSFRSTKGYQEVNKIAEELGGGGHQYAAGALMKGSSDEEILNRVLEAIKNNT
jgi:phosphoesterase RecJ-like protein